jgi:DNA-directed RNA polymerase specialized sigma24 family protein
MGWPSMLEDMQERRYEGLANMRRQAEQFEKPGRTKPLIFKRPERSVGGPLSALLERLNAMTPPQRKVFDQRVVSALHAAELAKAREADRPTPP